MEKKNQELHNVLCAVTWNGDVRSVQWKGEGRRGESMSKGRTGRGCGLRGR